MSCASIERDTSSAITTLRERTCIFWADCPHRGRDAAKRTSASPRSNRAACRPKSRGLGGIRRAFNAGATNEESRLSARARSSTQSAPATGTSATNANIQG